LIYKKGVFYLIVVQDVPEEKEYDPVDVLGIDLGIENIAVDSDREIFDCKKIENTRQRYFRLRKTLQHIGTRSKRKLRKISGKERRFKKDTNHCLSKYIISKAKGTARAIGIENLKYIRSRSRLTVKSQRDRRSKWAFGELRQFLTYKAKREGVPLRVPKDTSRECPKCQYVDKKNRNKNQFECLQCEYKDMADYVALPLALLGLRSNSLL